MSKQLKLKFKKILKEAEFTQADLEYHEELLPEAKQLFGEEISKIIASLSPEDQKLIEEADRLRQEAFKKELEKRMAESGDISEEEEEEDPTSLVVGDFDIEEEEDDPEGEASAPASKVGELKKMFYRIAERSHPDKLAAKGYSKEEITRLEGVFMRAREAYDSENWYQLYSIGLTLGIPLPDPSRENIKWVKEDIKNTLRAISKIAVLIVWVWYTGDEMSKFHAAQCHFKQVYDLDLVSTD
jgi:hypothetical protein